jgi:tetratricopeptide (TPR) repeat protein
LLLPAQLAQRYVAMRSLPFLVTAIISANFSASTASAQPAQNQPFDLTYLASPKKAGEHYTLPTGEECWNIPAVIALRPAAILSHPMAAPHARAIDEAVGGIGFFLGLGRFGPGAENIESVVVRGSWRCIVSPWNSKEKTRGMIGLGGAAGVVRSLKPFDWYAAARRSCPPHGKQEIVTYRDTSYLTIWRDARLFGVVLPKSRTRLGMAFYCPDDRTLLFDREEAIRVVIDRVKSGGTSPSPPGWEKIQRCTIAVAIDNHDKQWIHALPRRPGPFLSVSENSLLMDVDDIACGLDLGTHTRLQVVAYCSDQFRANEARHERRDALSFLVDQLGATNIRSRRPCPEEEALALLANELLTAGSRTPTPLGFEYTAEVPDDVFGFIIRFFSGPQFTSMRMTQHATELLSHKKIDEAIALLGEAIRLDPENSLAFAVRGTAWHKMGQYKQSLDDINESLRLDPKCVRAFLARCDVLAAKGEHEKAFMDVNEALRLDPRNVAALLNRGWLLQQKGETQLAWNDYNQAVQIDSTNGSAYHYRGSASHAVHDLDTAISDYNEAIRLGFSTAYVYGNRARAWCEKKDYVRALRDFDEVISQDPTLALAYADRAYLRRETGDLSGAIEDYTKAISLKPTSAIYEVLKVSRTV